MTMTMRFGEPGHTWLQSVHDTCERKSDGHTAGDDAIDVAA